MKKIFIAGHNGLVGKAFSRLLKKKKITSYFLKIKKS